ncbi:phenylacetate-CoA oxygenase subunit PaaC [Halorubellus sp. JP-L1]|uniref:1,2-phenylacetyl-CoA epoxidase subunit PaaC n=1 Tax=Halorubellus sp. JP-L1 TaxID=2715753 RepID=UPI0014090BB0|nr:1,2-phenylacetyl-CoA epoxidase subunit PaaC [Halorubellus sp. JP-L1]NHN40267.1 phenylacetate-CoA oxygenase subunit PaaC [Halorubellus sp. JP-L1]
MAAKESLPAPGELSDDQREAVEHLLYRLADDEFVAAERYTEWQVRSPTLESDLALANIAQDELGHARLWYDLLEDFEYTESELVWERDADEWRHSTLVEQPFETGDWADVILRTYLYDQAEYIRLEALEDSTYPRIRDRITKIIQEEDYHREHAENWMARLAEEKDGLERLQGALDDLFPYALTLFAPTDETVEDRIDDLGLRSKSLDVMREEWLDVVVPYLEDLGLDVGDAELPEQYDVHHSEFELPADVGRDRSHTDAWFDLQEEFTNTYRELDRHEANRIMKDPDEA